MEAFKATLKEQLSEIKNQIRANKTFDNHQSPQQQSKISLQNPRFD